MGSKIYRIEYHLPEFILTNQSLANEFGRWDPEKIEKKIGIRERRIAAENETAGDLAFKAGEKVLRKYPKNKIDMIILCTQSPDYFLPTTACLLQHRLGLSTNTSAFDFNQGCSGYIYGLAMAKSFIHSGVAENILFITTETYSKHIHPKDLALRTIFGDGAAATIIEKHSEECIYSFVLGTDGSGANNLIVPNGCFRSPYNENAEEKVTQSGDIYTNNNLFMSGPEIFNFTIESVPNLVKECLDKNNITSDEIDFYIFHQANKYMIEYLRKKIGIPVEKFYSNMMLTGNTVSASIPIAYLNAIQNEQIKTGDKVLLCGFGVGYSWGATIVEV